MSASIWYKDKRLYSGSGGVISNLSDRIMDTASYAGHLSDDVLAFVACLTHPSSHSLDYLSLEDLKVLTLLLIKAVNEFEKEGYFIIDAEEMEYLIKHNMPVDVRSDQRQALELIKGLTEVIEELEMERQSNVC